MTSTTPRFSVPPEIPPLRPPAPDRPWPVTPAPPAPPPTPPERRDRLPAGAEIVRLDLEDRLLERRIILLTGRLDAAAADRAVARVLLLDADGDEPIEVRLGCASGELDAAETLADTVDLARAEVRVTVQGAVGGPCLGVLAAADVRVAHPNALLTLQEPRETGTGTASELEVAAERHERLVRHLAERIAAAAGRGADEVAADLREGRVLDAQQALDYGLVQRVAAVR